MNDQQNHPLHGLGLKAMLTELVDHYGWEILAEQINVNCFKLNPSIKSSHKFLHRTTWAREKLEAFYLYKYKQFPLPDDDQHNFAPRNRTVELTPLSESPAVIELGDPEFFDDPSSGPVFPTKLAVQATRENVKSKTTSQSRRSRQSSDNETSDDSIKPDVKKNNTPKTSSADPWSKWRE